MSYLLLQVFFRPKFKGLVFVSGEEKRILKSITSK